MKTTISSKKLASLLQLSDEIEELRQLLTAAKFMTGELVHENYNSETFESDADERQRYTLNYCRAQTQAQIALDYIARAAETIAQASELCDMANGEA